MEKDIAAAEATDAEQLEDRRMTLLEHLQELRLRLRNAGIVWLAATATAAVFANDFFHFLARPVGAALQALGQPATIVKLSPTEARLLLRLPIVGSCVRRWRVPVAAGAWRAHPTMPGVEIQFDAA